MGKFILEGGARPRVEMDGRSVAGQKMMGSGPKMKSPIYFSKWPLKLLSPAPLQPHARTASLPSRPNLNPCTFASPLLEYEVTRPQAWSSVSLCRRLHFGISNTGAARSPKSNLPRFGGRASSTRVNLYALHKRPNQAFLSSITGAGTR